LQNIVCKHPCIIYLSCRSKYNRCKFQIPNFLRILQFSSNYNITAKLWFFYLVHKMYAFPVNIYPICIHEIISQSKHPYINTILYILELFFCSPPIPGPSQISCIYFTLTINFRGPQRESNIGIIQ